MAKENGGEEEKGAAGGLPKAPSTPIKAPKPPIPPRRSATMDQSSPEKSFDEKSSCEVIEEDKKVIKRGDEPTDDNKPAEGQKILKSRGKKIREINFTEFFFVYF